MNYNMIIDNFNRILGTTNAEIFGELKEQGKNGFPYKVCRGAECAEVFGSYEICLNSCLNCSGRL